MITPKTHNFFDKDIPQNSQAILDKFEKINGVTDYVVFNDAAIPIRYNTKTMTHTKAVHYAALISDFVQVANKIFKKEMNNVMGGDTNVSHIRMRTKKGTEFVITSDSGFTMCCIHDCTGENTVFIQEKNSEDDDEY